MNLDRRFSVLLLNDVVSTVRLFAAEKTCTVLYRVTLRAYPSYLNELAASLQNPSGLWDKYNELHQINVKQHHVNRIKTEQYIHNYISGLWEGAVHIDVPWN
jgi:hypothetical protein